jgi:hypothetical protein
MTFMDAIFDMLRDKPVGKINLASLVGGNMSIIAHVVPASELKLNQLQAEGGNCPRCSKPWVKKHVTHRLAEFDLWDAGCHCYPRCPYCGRILMVEVDEGLDGCVYCGPAICTRIVDKETEGEGKRRKYKAPCNGISAPTFGGFVCECGSVNKILRESHVITR